MPTELVGDADEATEEDAAGCEELRAEDKEERPGSERDEDEEDVVDPVPERDEEDVVDPVPESAEEVVDDVTCALKFGGEEAGSQVRTVTRATRRVAGSRKRRRREGSVIGYERSERADSFIASSCVASRRILRQHRRP